MNGNGNNNNAGATVAPKQRKQPRTKPAKRTIRDSNTTIATTPIGVRNTELPATAFRYAFSEGEKQLHDYLKAIFNPAKYCGRVPSGRAGFEIYTDVWRTRVAGEAVADASGSLGVVVGMPNWVEDGNYDGQPHAGSQSVGYTTMGYPIAYTDGSGPTGSIPGVTGAISGASAWKALQMPRPTDSAMDNNTRIRAVGAILSVHTVQSTNLGQGELQIAGTVNPQGGVSGGSINGGTWSTIEQTNDSVMAIATKAVPGWKSGDELSIVAIPSEQQCFEMIQVPSVANLDGNKCPIAHLSLLGRGLSNGARVSFSVTMIWESEVARTNRGDMELVKQAFVPPELLASAVAHARPLAVVPKIDGVHAVPFVQALGQHRPMAVEALARHPDLHSDFKGAGGFVPALSYKPAASASLLSKIGNFAKTAASTVKESGLLSKIPYVGPAIQGLANIFGNLFS